MRTILISSMLGVACLGYVCLGHGVLMAADAPTATGAKRNPFCAQFCFGFGASDPKYATPAEQMKLLRELGYDGYSHYGIDGLADVLKAVDENGLELAPFYLHVSLNTAQPALDDRLAAALASLKGRRTVVSLLMDGGPASKSEKEQRMADVVRQVADMAAASDLRVAVYPYYITVQEAVRIAEKSGRKNAGIVLSEVFFFISEDENDLAATLKSAMPHIYAVNLNGTDSGYKGKDLTRLIQTLDRGSFDNLKLLKPLREFGYTGPIGLHCCYVRGDVRGNLKRSLDAWKDLSTRLNIKGP